MNSIIYLSYASFAYILIILVVYFRKKKVHSEEINIYSRILVLVFFCLFFEIISAMPFLVNVLWLKSLLKKIFMICLTILFTNFLKYTVIIIKGLNYNFPKWQEYIRYFILFVVDLIILLSRIINLKELLIL